MAQHSNGAIPAGDGPDKVWNPTFTKIFILNTTLFMGQFMTITVIPKFVVYLGGGDKLVGVMVSLMAFASLAMRPFAGNAGVVFSKKRIQMLSISVVTLAFVLYALSSSIIVLTVARILHGCAMSFTTTTSLAIAGDALPRNKMGAGIGYFSLGQIIATAVGPNVGLILIDVVGYTNTFFVCAAASLAAGVLALTLKVPGPAEKKRFRMSLDGMFAKEALLPAVLILFIGMAYSPISSFLVLFAESRSVADIGLYFTVYAVVTLLSRPLTGGLCDRYGVNKVLPPALAFAALAVVIISFSSSLWMFLLGGVLSALGFGSSIPVSQALAMKSVGPDRRSVGSSTNYIGFDIGFLSGPILAGFIIAGLGYATMFRLMVIPIGISYILLLAGKSRIQNIESGKTAGVIEDGNE